MAGFALGVVWVMCIGLAFSQEKCTVPVTCKNADGSSTIKTLPLPTPRDIRTWKAAGARAKRQQERAGRQTATVSTSHCDEPGWLTGQGGECQYLVLEATMTWEDARKFCMKKGADLAYSCIRKGDNFRYLTDRLNGRNMRGFWIGLTDRKVEGEWNWLDGTSATNARWGTGQPDDKDGNQDCGWISPGVGYNIDDGDCKAQFFPLCERLI